MPRERYGFVVGEAFGEDLAVGEGVTKGCSLSGNVPSGLVWLVGSWPASGRPPAKFVITSTYSSLSRSTAGSR